jgi:hypothetical protein
MGATITAKFIFIDLSIPQTTYMLKNVRLLELKQLNSLPATRE